MEKTFNGILIIFILLMITAIIKYTNYFGTVSENFAVNLSNSVDGIKLNNNYYNPKIESESIEFNYDLNSDIYKQFQKEQENGAFMTPTYNADVINSKTHLSYDFNKLKTTNLDGIIPIENSDISIKEVYDNSVIDYKKLIPTKNKKSLKLDKGASNLQSYPSNIWEYDNEKQENGGLIKNTENYELYAHDVNNNTNSIF